MGDQRRFPRIDSMNFVAEEGVMLRTLDLSREGMLLEMSVPPALGTHLELNVALGEVVVKVKGRVVRHQLSADEGGPTAVGVLFERLAPTTERLLLDYLLKEQKRLKELDAAAGGDGADLAADADDSGDE